MKKTFLLFITIALLFTPCLLHGQADSTKHSADSVLIKGFYKTYEEFLNKKPSILLNFSTRLFTVSKEDLTIVGAEYTIIDSSDMFGDFWGFCDGENIFVAYGGFFDQKYWKLQCDGPNPYLFYGHNEVSLFPSIRGIIATAVAAALPPTYDLNIIDKNGRPQYASDFNVKRLLKDNKILFKEFKQEIYPTENLLIKYILRYNESKMQHN